MIAYSVILLYLKYATGPKGIQILVAPTSRFSFRALQDTLDFVVNLVELLQDNACLSKSWGNCHKRS